MHKVSQYLASEYPNMSETINKLTYNDPDFAALLSMYDRTDKKISGLEIQNKPPTDAYMRKLIRQRVKIKDTLVTKLTEQAN